MTRKKIPSKYRFITQTRYQGKGGYQKGIDYTRADKIRQNFHNIQEKMGLRRFIMSPLEIAIEMGLLKFDEDYPEDKCERKNLQDKTKEYINYINKEDNEIHILYNKENPRNQITLNGESFNQSDYELYNMRGHWDFAFGSKEIVAQELEYDTKKTAQFPAKRTKRWERLIPKVTVEHNKIIEKQKELIADSGSVLFENSRKLLDFAEKLLSKNRGAND